MQQSYFVSIITKDGLIRTGVKMIISEEYISFVSCGITIKKKRINDILSVALEHIDWQIGKWIVVRFIDETIKINSFLSYKQRIYNYLNSIV